MTLLFMAAGNGSRYGKLKQFDSLGPRQEFLMEFGIYDALQNGFDHLVAVTKKDNVSFLEEYLTKRLPKHVQLDVVAQEISDLPDGIVGSIQRQKPWGTAHAVWSARNVINSTFAIINADDYYGQAAFKNAALFIKENSDPGLFGLVTYLLKDTLSPYGSVSRGICRTKGNRLLSVMEHTKIESKESMIVDHDSGSTFTGNEPVSMNFWICQPTLFKTIENYLTTFFSLENNIQTGEAYLPFVVQDMISKNKVSVEVIPSNSNWFGVTYSSDKEKAVTTLKALTQKKLYPSPLWDKTNLL